MEKNLREVLRCQSTENRTIIYDDALNILHEMIKRTMIGFANNGLFRGILDLQDEFHEDGFLHKVSKCHNSHGQSLCEKNTILLRFLVKILTDKDADLDEIIISVNNCKITFDWSDY